MQRREDGRRVITEAQPGQRGVVDAVERDGDRHVLRKGAIRSGCRARRTSANEPFRLEERGRARGRVGARAPPAESVVERAIQGVEAVPAEGDGCSSMERAAVWRELQRGELRVVLVLQPCTPKVDRVESDEELMRARAALRVGLAHEFRRLKEERRRLVGVGLAPAAAHTVRLGAEGSEALAVDGHGRAGHERSTARRERLLAGEAPPSIVWRERRQVCGLRIVLVANVGRDKVGAVERNVQRDGALAGAHVGARRRAQTDEGRVGNGDGFGEPYAAAEVGISPRACGEFSAPSECVKARAEECHRRAARHGASGGEDEFRTARVERLGAVGASRWRAPKGARLLVGDEGHPSVRIVEPIKRDEEAHAHGARGSICGADEQRVVNV